MSVSTVPGLMGKMTGWGMVSYMNERVRRGETGESTSKKDEQEKSERKGKCSETILTKVREIVVQFAHDPVDGGLGRAVGVHIDRQLRRNSDAPDGGGNGHELGRLALLQQRIRFLKENERPVGVDLRIQVSFSLPVSSAKGNSP